MKTNGAEIAAETRFHKGARRRVHWMTGRAEDLMNKASPVAAKTARRVGRGLEWVFLTAGIGFAADLRWNKRGRPGAVTLSHNLLPDPLRLVLQRIIDGAKLQFGLNGNPEPARGGDLRL